MTPPHGSIYGRPGSTIRMKESARNHSTYNHLLYYPENYNQIYTQAKLKKYPFLLFLHGSGECGNDLNLLKNAGLPQLIADGAQYPFVIAAPQCPHGQWWDSGIVYKLLVEIIKILPVDESRIYVTGLSMGGSGTWALANDHPDCFSAIIPICGLRTDIDPKRFKHLPVWCLHGENDDRVPLENSIEMIERIKNEGCDARFTVYPDTGHDAWTRTYKNREWVEWLLRHKKQPDSLT